MLNFSFLEALDASKVAPKKASVKREYESNKGTTALIMEGIKALESGKTYNVQDYSDTNTFNNLLPLKCSLKSIKTDADALAVVEQLSTTLQRRKALKAQLNARQVARKALRDCLGGYAVSPSVLKELRKVSNNFTIILQTMSTETLDEKSAFKVYAGVGATNRYKFKQANIADPSDILRAIKGALQFYNDCKRNTSNTGARKERETADLVKQLRAQGVTADQLKALLK